MQAWSEEEGEGCKNSFIKVGTEPNQEEGGLRGAKQRPSIAMFWDKVKVTLKYLEEDWIVHQIMLAVA